jgi:hypothetical protein
MEQDIRDATLWLIKKHGLPRTRVRVDRPPHVDREIAGATFMASPSTPARLTAAAQRPFSGSLA